VTRALFKAVEKQRERRARTRGGSEGRLLSGLLHCGECGHILTLDWMTRKGEPYYMYRCRAEGCAARPVIAAQSVEAKIEGPLRERLTAGDFRIETADDDAAQLREELETVNAELADWITADVQVSAQSWQARTKVLEARVAAAQAALDEVAVAGVAEPLPSLEKYDLLPVPLQRQVVDAFIKALGGDNAKLVVLPGREADRVRLAGRLLAATKAA
jgi:hypothetical protein